MLRYVGLGLGLMAAIVLILAAFRNDAVETLPDHDVIVVGAGIAGLSAALELGRGGARVLVVEMNSVGGGHAVMAGGFAFADTPLQRARGIADSPDLAFEDWMTWGETNDPYWTRQYAEQSTALVHDWLTELGVEFKVLLPSPENSVRRFHFTQGKAVHAVLPILREALSLRNVSFAWNTRAVELVADGGRIGGLRMRDIRSGEETIVTGRYVLLATGGFQNDLDRVRANWASGKAPALLKGAGQFATGSGHDLADAAGAGRNRYDRHVTFINGLRDPREPDSALVVSNPDWIWVNAEGKRFANEVAPDKEALPSILDQSADFYWAVVDGRGVGKYRIRDAVWLNAETVEREIIENPDRVQKADTIEDLAQLMAVPADELSATVARYNAFVESKLDIDFSRFDASDRQTPGQITEPPFYAMKLHPVTRKNLGGVAVGSDLQVVDQNGSPIDGLFAAGELTGVVGINGDHGMSGTFLGPSVFTGRLAGKSILTGLKRDTSWLPDPAGRYEEPVAPEEAATPGFDARMLSRLVDMGREGYWHFETAHRYVLEKEMPCASCHDVNRPMRAARNNVEKRAQTSVCLTCH